MTLSDVEEVVFLDFEFRAPDGERPHPVCFVALEQKSGRVIRRWVDNDRPIVPPFAIGPRVLVVAYYASAELNCFRVLGWPYPRLVIDLYAEWRVATNGLHVGRSLLDALKACHIESITTAKKELSRNRILAGGRYSAEEQRDILEYCESDVRALQQLFSRLIRPNLPLNLALVRGAFMKAIASAEYNGVPIDVPLYKKMNANWEILRKSIIDRVNNITPVFENYHFRMQKFKAWLEHKGWLMTWPATQQGLPAIDENSFKQMAVLHPELEPLRQARQMLGELRKLNLPVGSDGRNRCLLSPFSTKTGRGAPSTAKFSFSVPHFMRGLIRPEPGKHLAYVDFASQEFAIAAALSGDPNMQACYRTGDPYLALGKMVGAVPASATKKSHAHERNMFKKAALGVQYGIGAEGLAAQIGVTLREAQNLIDAHRRSYPKFWAWNENVIDYMQLRGYLQAAYGWTLRCSPTDSFRTWCNWPMQSNGGEILRLSCISIEQAGVSILAPVHDAVLIEAPSSDIEQAVAVTRAAMRRASELVLAGFAINTDYQVIHYPDRFPVEKGEMMWRWITETLAVLPDDDV
jgi:hypothetical protein